MKRLENKKFEEGNNKFLSIKKLSYRYMAGFQTSTRLFDGLMYAIGVIAGSLFIINGTLTAPQLVTYLLYISTLLTSIRRIVEFMEQFQRGMTGIERFIEIMDAPVEIQDAPDAKALTDVKGDIRFEDVSFHYGDDGKEVLHHIDLHVRPGENVALSGAFGRRQNHPLQPNPPVLRRHGRPGVGGWTRCAYPAKAIFADANRCGTAGSVPI